jgi:hypothetical protein
MILELQQNGHPGVQAILDKYGFRNTDWGTTAFKIRKADGSVFLG